MIQDKLGNEIFIGDTMVFSAGKSIELYEVLKLKEDTRNSAWSKVFVNVGSSKKWKEAVNGLKHNITI